MKVKPTGQYRCISCGSLPHSEVEMHGNHGFCGKCGGWSDFEADEFKIKAKKENNYYEVNGSELKKALQQIEEGKLEKSVPIIYDWFIGKEIKEGIETGKNMVLLEQEEIDNINKLWKKR